MEDPNEAKAFIESELEPAAAGEYPRLYTQIAPYHVAMLTPTLPLPSTLTLAPQA